jgi:hypothetical protein
MRVVAGGKIDERASFLASPFFPAKNSEDKYSEKSHIPP